jgi:hypothetical protein
LGILNHETHFRKEQLMAPIRYIGMALLAIAAYQAIFAEDRESAGTIATWTGIIGFAFCTT